MRPVGARRGERDLAILLRQLVDVLARGEGAADFADAHRRGIYLFPEPGRRMPPAVFLRDTLQWRNPATGRMVRVAGLHNGDIYISPRAPDIARTLCHELGHALTPPMPVANYHGSLWRSNFRRCLRALRDLQN